MHIHEFLRSKAEEFEKKFRKSEIDIHIFQERENGLFVVQIPHCDELFTRMKKFKQWKTKFEQECLDFLDEAFILVTDSYELNSSFKKIY